MIHTPEGWVRDRSKDEEHEVAAFTATMDYLDRLQVNGTDEDLEIPLGPLVDRVLLDHGIHQVDAFTRPMLLRAFWLALKDAMEARRRNATGDYTPISSSSRFPGWQSPVAAKGNTASPSNVISLQNSLRIGGWNLRPQE